MPSIQRIVAEYSLALWFAYLPRTQRKWMLYLVTRQMRRRWRIVRCRLVG